MDLEPKIAPPQEKKMVYSLEKFARLSRILLETQNRALERDTKDPLGISSLQEELAKRADELKQKYTSNGTSNVEKYAMFHVLGGVISPRAIIEQPDFPVVPIDDSVETFINRLAEKYN